MHVRMAVPDDSAGITGVHIRSSRVAYANLPPSLLAVSPAVRQAQWDAVLREPDSRVWVALDDGAVVGFCHLRLPVGGLAHERSAEIGSLYVEPGEWGRGIGRRLVETARHAAAATGYRLLSLEVYADNLPARAAYEALGFTAEPGTRVHERSGLALMRYGLRLDPSG